MVNKVHKYSLGHTYRCMERILLKQNNNKRWYFVSRPWIESLQQASLNFDIPQQIRQWFMLKEDNTHDMSIQQVHCWISHTKKLKICLNTTLGAATNNRIFQGKASKNRCQYQPHTWYIFQTNDAIQPSLDANAHIKREKKTATISSCLRLFAFWPWNDIDLDI